MFAVAGKKIMNEKFADVGVEKNRGLVERKTRNSACGIRPDAGKCFEKKGIGGNDAIKPLQAICRAFFQIKRAAVVSHALPFLQNFVEWSRGDIPDGGKCGEEFRKFIERAGNLRLLEHDLGNENLIGSDRALLGKAPGKVISLILFIPF